MKHVFPLILLTLSAPCFSQSPDCIVNGFEIYADPANEVALDGNMNPDPCLLHENRVNLVILPDGYTVNGTDFEQYRSQKDAFLDQLFDNPNADPFPQYRSYFNVYWVWVASPEPGIGCIHTTDPNDPQATICDDHVCPAPTWYWVSCLGESTTYFEFKRDREGFHRFILSDDSEAIVNAVQTDIFSNTTAPLTIAVMGNSIGTSETHKGGGAEQYVSGDVGIFCVASGSNQSSYPDANPNNNAALEESGNVAVHELAHSFANLLDEYWFDVTTIGLSQNAYNQSTNPDASDPNHPWAVWMDDDVVINQPISDVDVYEFVKCDEQAANYCNCFATPGGANIPTSVYKPTSGQCRMEVSNGDVPFCPVCREQIIEKIHGYVKPYDEESATPNINDVHEASSSLVFDPAIIEPDPSYIIVNWYVNDVLVETIDAAGADAGLTDYTWQFDCSDVNLDTEDPNIIRAEIFDVTGYDDTSNPSGPPYMADTRLVRKTSHTTNHKYNIEWTVNYNGIVSADLFVRDYDSDDGTEPTSGYPIDHSPDVVVRNNQMSTPLPAWGSSSFLTEDPDIDNSPSYIYVRVQNKGCEASDAGTLAVYTSVAGGGLSWDANWTDPSPGLNSLGYQIGADPVSPIDGGTEVILEMTWNMVDLTGLPNWESCLLVRLEDFDDAINPETYLSDWIWNNNNIAMHNVSVVNMVNPPISEISGKPYAGGWTYTGNTESQLDTFNLRFDVDNDKISKNVLDESEIIVYFEESGFDISGAILDQNLVGMTRIDSTLFRITSDHARIDSIIVPGDTLIPTFIGFAFLTEEVDSLYYLYHLGRYKSGSPDSLLYGQHYDIRRVSRNLFTADAGDDEIILSGDTITLSAGDIGEDALYFWLDSNGDTLQTGIDMDVWPSSTTTYTLEVIAEEDGYKDYDEVTITVTNGLITSVAPNPASSTTTVYYETSGVTTVKLKVVEVGSMMQVDNFTVTAGTGSKVITVSGYNTGAHIITLEGDSEDLDSETLIVQ